MMLEMFKSKLHPLTVTQADLYYEGSITIDEELLEAAGIYTYEKVQVVNINNGTRLDTYAIPGDRGGRQVCMNGPAARLASVGDRIIVISYARLTEDEARSHKPCVVFMDSKNNPVKTVHKSVAGLRYHTEEESTLE
ncbi:MAG: aspartate 1-decarboxylase [Balneolales bacterium]